MTISDGNYLPSTTNTVGEVHDNHQSLPIAGKTSREKTGFLNSVDHFRSLAILFVVSGHCFAIAGMKFETILEKAVANIVTGGTFLFVFISGFLFHYIFYNKYEYKKFLIGKIRNVLIPYMILGLVPVVMFVIHKSDGWGGFFLPQGSGFLQEYLWPGLKYYLTGAFLTAYWYIPFIILTFLMSPLHYKFVNTSIWKQLSIISCLSTLSVLIHRPLDNLQILQAVIYFSPVYLIGILCSVYKEQIYEVMTGKELVLLGVAVLLAVYEAYSGSVGSYHKEALEFSGLDIMFIQKILLCIFLMVFLHRFESVSNKYLHILAATSFAVFFMHPFVIWGYRELFLKQLSINSWWMLILIIISVVALCVLLAKGVKAILPGFSRYLIGY